jgi:hypothetical protein
LNFVPSGTFELEMGHMNPRVVFWVELNVTDVMLFIAETPPVSVEFFVQAMALMVIVCPTSPKRVVRSPLDEREGDAQLNPDMATQAFWDAELPKMPALRSTTTTTARTSTVQP